jgi:hypothetical protein
MGYTHHFGFKQPISPEQWEQVRKDIGEIMRAAFVLPPGQRVFLVGPEGKGKTKVTSDDYEISFNGIGKDGRDSFNLYRTGTQDFCKTERKRYDLVVTAVLCYLDSTVRGFSVSSDGHGPDFLDGLDLASQALPDMKDRLRVPLDVMRNDRWIPPRGHIRTDAYEFRFCVDGHAYVTDLRRKRHYRFDSHVQAATWAVGHGDVLDASGMFDKARIGKLARRQATLFRLLLDKASAEGRDIAPPEICPPELFMAAKRTLPFCYYYADVLAHHGLAAAA